MQTILLQKKGNIDTKFLKALCFIDDIFCCSFYSSSRVQVHVIGNNFPPKARIERVNQHIT